MNSVSKFLITVATLLLVFTIFLESKKMFFLKKEPAKRMIWVTTIDTFKNGGAVLIGGKYVSDTTSAIDTLKKNTFITFAKVPIDTIHIAIGCKVLSNTNVSDNK